MNGLDFVNEIAAQVGLEPLKRLIDEYPKHRYAQSKRASCRNARVPSPLTRRSALFQPTASQRQAMDAVRDAAARSGQHRRSRCAREAFQAMIFLQLAVC
jgi:hypothetical protein